MAISDATWDGAASNYKDTNDYCSACLIDDNPPGEKKTQDNCKLPYKFPSGDISRNGVHAAASALAGGRGGVSASSQSKKAAAKKLVRLYGQLKEDCPPSIKNMAM